MPPHIAVEPVDDRPAIAPGSESPRSRRPRRRLWKVLIGIGAVLLLLIVAAGLWFFLGRDRARQLDNGEALTDFRARGGASPNSAGGPPAGVYAATASGNESIGLPGFDESLGPRAPVTVTHGGGGCYTYRADFNSHHWRSWTFCPTERAKFSLTRLDSWTERKAPGLDIATLTTYTCEHPLDFLWQGANISDTRTGACTGTSDMDHAVTADAGSIEVLDVGTLTVDRRSVDVIHLRTIDTFSQAQTGSEVDEWWVDANTGLPVKVVVELSIKGGPSEYTETPRLELSTLTPAT
jgi:hypothetical protein